MLRILILAAMEIERESLVAALSQPSSRELVGDIQIVDGILDGARVSIVRMGIGKVNAAMVTTLALQSASYDLVINTGVAGALDASLQVGDVVISNELAYHDVNACHFGYAWGQVPGMPEWFVSADNQWLEAFKHSVSSREWTLHFGQIVSGDSFIGSMQQREDITRNFPLAKAVEMEGAAVAHVAHLFNVPFFVVRAISDNADGAAKMSYNDFLELASVRSSQIVRELLNVATKKRS